MSMIECSTCGSYKVHAAHGLCRSCYSRDKYQREREQILANKKATDSIRQAERQEKICRRLWELLTPMIPTGAESRHLRWQEATDIYNRNQHSKEHFMALCRAVQFQGEPWGLIAHGQPVGGIEIRRIEL